MARPSMIDDIRKAMPTHLEGGAGSSHRGAHRRPGQRVSPSPQGGANERMNIPDLLGRYAIEAPAIDWNADWEEYVAAVATAVGGTVDWKATNDDSRADHPSYAGVIRLGGKRYYAEVSADGESVMLDPHGVNVRS